MKTRPFFVYGTLKVGGTLSHRFDEFRESCVEGVLPGYALYDLGWFPGIIKDSEEEVFGEIHTYNEEYYGRVLTTFDNIEGYSDFSRAQSLYLRDVVHVVDENNNKVCCNCYIFNNARKKSMKTYNIIPNGIWDITFRSN